MLNVHAPVNERWVPVSDPARALALDIQIAANRLAMTLGNRSATPQAMADAVRQVQRLSDLIDVIEGEI